MKGTDAVLALLQDIKEILYGIAWLILAGILCIIGVLLETGLGILLLLIGLGVCVGGILYARHGYGHHEVLENKDE